MTQKGQTIQNWAAKVHELVATDGTMAPKLMINYTRKLDHVKIKSTTIKTFVIHIQYSLQHVSAGFLHKG